MKKRVGIGVGLGLVVISSILWAQDFENQSERNIPEVEDRLSTQSGTMSAEKAEVIREIDKILDSIDYEEHTVFIGGTDYSEIRGLDIGNKEEISKIFEIIESNYGIQNLEEAMQDAVKALAEHNKNEDYLVETAIIDTNSTEVSIEIIYDEYEDEEHIMIYFSYDLLEEEKYQPFYEATQQEGYAIAEVVTGGKKEKVVYKSLETNKYGRNGYYEIKEEIKYHKNSEMNVEVLFENEAIESVSAYIQDWWLKEDEVMKISQQGENLFKGILEEWGIEDDTITLIGQEIQQSLEDVKDETIIIDGYQLHILQAPKSSYSENYTDQAVKITVKKNEK